MGVGEFIDISDLPERIVYCSVRCPRNLTKDTRSFKFSNVSCREDARNRCYFSDLCLRNSFFIVLPEMVKEDDGILNKQSLMTVAEYSNGFQKRFIFIPGF